MKKEPGENSAEGSQEEPIEVLKGKALNALAALMNIMYSVEQENLVNLDKPIDGAHGATPAKHFLKNSVETAKASLDYLDKKLRKNADDLILRAEIYLSTHKPKKEK